jgi:hypothetical protein
VGTGEALGDEDRGEGEAAVPTDPVSVEFSWEMAVAAMEASEYWASDTVSACCDAGSHHNRQRVGKVVPAPAVVGSRR